MVLAALIELFLRLDLESDQAFVDRDEFFGHDVSTQQSGSLKKSLTRC